MGLEKHVRSNKDFAEKFIDRHKPNFDPMIYELLKIPYVPIREKYICLKNAEIEACYIMRHNKRYRGYIRNLLSDYRSMVETEAKYRKKRLK